jgi:hypothetical protein
MNTYKVLKDFEVTEEGSLPIGSYVVDQEVDTTAEVAAPLVESGDLAEVAGTEEGSADEGGEAAA